MLKQYSATYRRPSQYCVERWEWYQYVPDWPGTVKLYLLRAVPNEYLRRKERICTYKNASFGTIGHWVTNAGPSISAVWAWNRPCQCYHRWSLRDKISAITQKRTMDVARSIVGSVSSSITLIYRHSSIGEITSIKTSHTRNWSPIFPEIIGPGIWASAVTVLRWHFS